MLKKRLWTALLALMAVVGMAGGALAATGDATIGFTFSNPADILDINFLVDAGPYRTRLESVAAGNPVDTTNHPNFNAQWNATTMTGTAVI
ncbi:MAG: hypothetical protein IJR68_02820, partial [Fretibacterium sp.]|nr:hypothetical protein [Fretibacterium sp.]